MADSTLDILRQTAFAKRINNADGHRIHWSTEQIAELRDYVMSAPEKLLRAPIQQRTFIDHGRGIADLRAKLMGDGTVASSDASAATNEWIVRVTTEEVDHSGDEILSNGVRSDAKHLPVLMAHASDRLPVARSSALWKVGTSHLAKAIFDKGVSAEGDAVAAAVRSGLVKGASIGFMPIKYKFSPLRPLSIIFEEIFVLEWSFCACPRNQACLVIGPASNKSAPGATRSAADGSDWQCRGIATSPIDASDDAFDSSAAKAALLAQFSPSGTILDVAQNYFLAVDVSKPFDSASYKYPFCRIVDGIPVAAKTGWRQSFVALEKASLPSFPLESARAVIDVLEARLGDIKAVRR